MSAHNLPSSFYLEDYTLTSNPSLKELKDPTSVKMKLKVSFHEMVNLPYKKANSSIPTLLISSTVPSVYFLALLSPSSIMLDFGHLETEYDRLRYEIDNSAAFSYKSHSHPRNQNIRFNETFTFDLILPSLFPSSFLTIYMVESLPHLPSINSAQLRFIQEIKKDLIQHAANPTTSSRIHHFPTIGEILTSNLKVLGQCDLKFSQFLQTNEILNGFFPIEMEGREFSEKRNSPHFKISFKTTTTM